MVSFVRQARAGPATLIANVPKCQIDKLAAPPRVRGVDLRTGGGLVAVFRSQRRPTLLLPPTSTAMATAITPHAAHPCRPQDARDVLQHHFCRERRRRCWCYGGGQSERLSPPGSYRHASSSNCCNSKELFGKLSSQLPGVKGLQVPGLTQSVITENWQAYVVNAGGNTGPGS